MNTQLKQSQDTLKEKENSVQQLQAELKTTQGSLSQEVKKFKAQVSELQTSLTKKACWVSFHTYVSQNALKCTHSIPKLTALFSVLKGIVHPKMKNFHYLLSLMLFQTWMLFFVLLIFLSIHWKSMRTNILQNIFFCVLQKKVIQIW